jgi:MFS transporter, ACS family, DAL5 transporter family protein
MGYKNVDAQLFSTPPYILAMCVTLLFAYVSDMKGTRGPCILVSEALAIIGFSVLLATKKAAYGYVGTFLACAGTYSTVPVLVSWASNNTGGDTKRGVRIALMVGLGNLGGICSSFVYRCAHSNFSFSEFSVTMILKRVYLFIFLITGIKIERPGTSSVTES